MATDKVPQSNSPQNNNQNAKPASAAPNPTNANSAASRPGAPGTQNNETAQASQNGARVQPLSSAQRPGSSPSTPLRSGASSSAPRPAATASKSPASKSAASKARPGGSSRPTASAARPAAQSAQSASRSASAALNQGAASVRNFTERGVKQAKNMYDNARASAEEATDVLEESYAATSKGMAEWNMKALEAFRTQANSAFDTAEQMLNARSLSQAIELQTAYVRKQFETITECTKDLSALANKLLSQSSKPYQDLASNMVRSGIGGLGQGRGGQGGPQKQAGRGH